MPRPTAIDAARKFKDRLAKDEAAAAERMAIIYDRIYKNLLGDARGLAEQLAGMDEISLGKITKLARVQALLSQVRDQVTRFGGTAQNEILLIENQAVQAGIDDALRLMQFSLPAGTGGIAGSFTRLHPDAIIAAAGLMGPDSPLNEKLTAQFGEYVADQIEAHFLDGIGAGMRADRIVDLLSRNLQNGLGSGLTSLLTTLRTAQIKAYQIANHSTYLANSNVVTGWVWVAALDARTCISCIEQHGTVHPLTETLNDHHNGRCAPVPETVTYKDLGLDIPETVEPIESGPDWFDRQPATTQRELMGGAMYDAYKAGQVGFGDFSRKYDDAVYGELLREASLKDILGDKAKEFYKQ